VKRLLRIAVDLPIVVSLVLIDRSAHVLLRLLAAECSDSYQ